MREAWQRQHLRTRSRAECEKRRRRDAAKLNEMMKAPPGRSPFGRLMECLGRCEIYG
jgi:hypothetical protein